MPTSATNHSKRVVFVFADTDEFPSFHIDFDPASGGTYTAEGFLVRSIQRGVRLRFRAQYSDS